MPVWKVFKCDCGQCGGKTWVWYEDPNAFPSMGSESHVLRHGLHETVECDCLRCVVMRTRGENGLPLKPWTA